MKRRVRLLILIGAIAATVGVVLTLSIRHLEFLNAFACGDAGGDWVRGHCKGAP